jgi:CHASE3 domain sensor protein
MNDTQNSNLLIRLVGSILVLLIACAAINTLGLRMAQKELKDDFTRVTHYLQAANLARTAQVHFKTEVQEWKNILLRGKDPAEFAHYRESMNKETQLVDDSLKELQTLLQENALHTTSVQTLQASHHTLVDAYRSAIDKHSALGTDEAASIDRSLRGQDRPLGQAIDTLVEGLSGEAESQRALAAANADASVSRISTLVYGGAFLCAAVLLYLLRIVTRRQPS